MIDWHRLFGLILLDYFLDSPYTVELEKDLSLQQQLLDVVIIEQGEGELKEELPDGLDNLGRHNLLTYKSLRQPLDAWALDELVGHYVNYCKQLSLPGDALAPEHEFCLYGVCTRDPQKLKRQVTLRPLQDGVYQTVWGTHDIRVIVLSQIPPLPRNAVWQLFSGIPEQVRSGAEHYHWHRDDHSRVITQLYEAYHVEGITMAYTWDDYFRDVTKEHLKDLTPEEILTIYSPEELLKKLPPEERLKGIAPEERLKDLSPNDLLKTFVSDEILQQFTAEDIDTLLNILRQKQQETQQN